MNRTTDDIDARDKNHDASYSCYLDDMYAHFSALELEFMVDPTYMLTQSFINEKVRTSIVDWMVSIIFKNQMPILIIQLKLNKMIHCRSKSINSLSLNMKPYI